MSFNIQKRYKHEYLTGDLLALFISFIIAMTIRFGPNWDVTPRAWIKWYVLAFSFIIFVDILCMYFYRMYDMKYRFILAQIPKIVQAFIYSVVLFIIATFFIRSISFSRLTFIYYILIGIPVLITFRFIMNRRIKKMFEAGIGVKRLLFIDLSDANIEIINYLKEHKEFGIVVEGGLSQDGVERTDIDILGKIDNYKKIIDAYGIDIVLLSNYDGVSSEIIEYCENNYKQIFMIPHIINLVSNPVDIGYINSIPLITLRESRLTSFEGKLKRVSDFFLSIVGLVTLSPIYILIAIMIKISSPGPVLFKHKRLGMNGHYIYVYKFRTMVTNAEEVLSELFKNNPTLKEQYNKDFKLPNDPRITPFGRFLRKTSLDELPQLLNILKGEISIVGPRPIVAEEMEKYGEHAKYILRVPPGLTGLWQVSGRSDVSYNDRIQLDMYYINNWNFMMDITIILKTIPAVLARKGAY